MGPLTSATLQQDKRSCTWTIWETSCCWSARNWVGSCSTFVKRVCKASKPSWGFQSSESNTRETSCHRSSRHRTSRHPMLFCKDLSKLPGRASPITLHPTMLPCLDLVRSSMGVASEIIEVAATRASSNQCWKTQCLNVLSAGSKVWRNRKLSICHDSPKAASFPKIWTKFCPLSWWMGDPFRTSWTRHLATSKVTSPATLAVQLLSKPRSRGWNLWPSTACRNFPVSGYVCSHASTSPCLITSEPNVPTCRCRSNVAWMVHPLCRKGAAKKDNTKTSVQLNHRGRPPDLPAFHQASGSYKHLHHWTKSQFQ